MIPQMFRDMCRYLTTKRFVCVYEYLKSEIFQHLSHKTNFSAFFILFIPSLVLLPPSHLKFHILFFFSCHSTFLCVAADFCCYYWINPVKWLKVPFTLLLSYTIVRRIYGKFTFLIHYLSHSIRGRTSNFWLSSSLLGFLHSHSPVVECNIDTVE